ncbi:MAG: response regulator [Vicinamibacterales bacterium]
MTTTDEATGPSESGWRADDSAGHILVVDDLPANTRVLEALLLRDGYRVTCAENGEQALEEVARKKPDLVLLDIVMPKLDGYEVCRRLKADPATRLIPVVLVTGLTDTDSRIRGLEVGADDFMSKPFIVPEMRARVASLLRIKRYTDALDSAESVILSLAMTIEARDRATEGHCQRLAQYAVALGERLGLSRDDLDALRIGGYLHDIGKVGIPDRILLKDGQLTTEEYESDEDAHAHRRSSLRRTANAEASAADRAPSSRASRWHGLS